MRPSTIATFLALLMLALLMLALLILPGCGPRYRSTTTMSRTAEHVGGSAVEVHTSNGFVRLIGSPSAREVEIDTRVTCGGATQVEADQRVADATIKVMRKADGALRIEPVFPGGRRSGDGASLTVTLPDVDGVDVHTSNGAVTVNGLAGELVIVTSNGGIDVAGHRGFADLHTSNGSVDVTDVHGAVLVKTSNASVAIELADDAEGPVVVKSSNGGIRLRVGASFAGRVRMDTSNARVQVTDPSGRARAVEIGRTEGSARIGDGGEPSSLRTSNASVKLIVGRD